MGIDGQFQKKVALVPNAIRCGWFSINAILVIQGLLSLNG